MLSTRKNISISFLVQSDFTSDFFCGHACPSYAQNFGRRPKKKASAFGLY
jgi:hypothetical protein